MQKQGRKNLVIVILCLVVIAIFAGTFYSNYMRQQSNKAHQAISITNNINGTVFSQPRTISPFKLVSNTNHPFTNANLKGHWTLMFFGFTNCPDICPTTMAVLKQFYDQLGATASNKKPQVVLVSVDPKRDTPKALNDYVQVFNKHFIGVTGNEIQIKQLTHEMGVVYMQIMQKQGEHAQGGHARHYTIDHSGVILLIDPNGDLYALFNNPQNAKILVKDYNAVVQHYAKTQNNQLHA